MRIVADTNVLISSLFWNGAPYRLVQAALDGKFEIVTAPSILREAQRVLKRDFDLGAQEIDDIVICLRSFVKVVKPAKTPKAVRDALDNHILACALGGRARYIVTRDEDLLVLKEYQGIAIVTPEEFLGFPLGGH